MNFLPIRDRCEVSAIVMRGKQRGWRKQHRQHSFLENKNLAKV